MRRSWRTAVKRTLADATTDLTVIEMVLACWTIIHTVAADQDSDCRPPTLTQRDMDGGWEFDNSGVSAALTRRHARAWTLTRTGRVTARTHIMTRTLPLKTASTPTTTTGTKTNDRRAPLMRRHGFYTA